MVCVEPGQNPRRPVWFSHDKTLNILGSKGVYNFSSLVKFHLHAHLVQLVILPCVYANKSVIHSNAVLKPV